MSANNNARIAQEITPAINRACENFLASTKDLRARLVALQNDSDANSAATTALNALDTKISAIQA
jgi:hypothetical protein